MLPSRDAASVLVAYSGCFTCVFRILFSRWKFICVRITHGLRPSVRMYVCALQSTISMCIWWMTAIRVYTHCAHNNVFVYTLQLLHMKSVVCVRWQSYHTLGLVKVMNVVVFFFFPFVHSFVSFASVGLTSFECRARDLTFALIHSTTISATYRNELSIKLCHGICAIPIDAFVGIGFDVRMSMCVFACVWVSVLMNAFHCCYYVYLMRFMYSRFIHNAREYLWFYWSLTCTWLFDVMCKCVRTRLCVLCVFPIIQSARIIPMVFYVKMDRDKCVSLCSLPLESNVENLSSAIK